MAKKSAVLNETDRNNIAAFQHTLNSSPWTLQRVIKGARDEWEDEVTATVADGDIKGRDHARLRTPELIDRYAAGDDMTPDQRDEIVDALQALQPELHAVTEEFGAVHFTQRQLDEAAHSLVCRFTLRTTSESWGCTLTSDGTLTIGCQAHPLDWWAGTKGERFIAHMYRYEDATRNEFLAMRPATIAALRQKIAEAPTPAKKPRARKTTKRAAKKTTAKKTTTRRRR